MHTFQQTTLKRIRFSVCLIFARSPVLLFCSSKTQKLRQNMLKKKFSNSKKLWNTAWYYCLNSLFLLTFRKHTVKKCEVNMLALNIFWGSFTQLIVFRIVKIQFIFHDHRYLIFWESWPSFSFLLQAFPTCQALQHIWVYSLSSDL